MVFMVNNIFEVSINDELIQSYISYAMSVIVGRALPDIRDGLKPVHRRILYAMKEMGNTYNNSHKKSARIVGDVIGKYHPHGESAVYESIVRLAQSFTQRYTLIDGQGNFGSIDGDPAAAMRYTEIRMSEISDYLLKDIDYDTVDYVSNYDNTEKQPIVLPAKFPNLLINGTSGIAVGVATNIPPHNLIEVIDACIYYIDNNSCSVDDLIKYVNGPDFPTSAFINGIDGIISAYKTGKGKINIRANVSIDYDKKHDKYFLIVKELPYHVNKAKLIDDIASLVREKKILGISYLRDESDKEGLRIFISLEKGASPNIVLNNLYSLSKLEIVFGINMVALVNGKPKLLNLLDIISSFVNHRREIVYRKTLFQLKKAKDKVHILEGLCIAIINIDGIINILKSVDTASFLKEKLSNIIWNCDDLLNLFDKEVISYCKHPNFNNFNSDGYILSDIQVNSILDLKLYKLTKLEKNNLFSDYRKLSDEIKDYISLINIESNLVNVIKNEFIFLKNKFGDLRKTKILSLSNEINKFDLIPKEKLIITLSNYGYIKSQYLKNYQAQHRKGRGKSATSVKNDDFIINLLTTNRHSKLLCFSNYGKIYWIDLCEFTIYSRESKGVPIINLLKLESNEKISAILSIESYDKDVFIFMVTKNGLVKRVPLLGFKNQRSNGIIAVDLHNNDILVAAKIVNIDDEIILFSSIGKAIRFSVKDVRSSGRLSKGVIGMRLGKNEFIISLIVVRANKYILAATKNGYGKKTPVSDFPITNRGVKGVIGIKIDNKNGNVIGVEEVSNEDEIMLITNKGVLVRIRTKEVSTTKRIAKGVLLINLFDNEYLVNINKIIL